MNVHIAPSPATGPLERSVPRYTSYPTAPNFKADLGPQVMDTLLEQLDPQKPVSLYLHIPFCDRLCWFCGCHTRHTLKYAPVSAYVDVLLREIELMRERACFAVPVSRIHFGGGSPSMLRAGDAARIHAALERSFSIVGDAEISVEIDPSDIDDGHVDAMKELGITRASIGVQDFDGHVQAAINRPQSFECTHRVVVQLRDMGVNSLNIDALYGLPHQTLDTISDTIAKVVELAPDRVALFGYAHVPWVKKHQRMIPDEALPGPQERLAQAALAAQLLGEAGYKAIGIDHFALPQDDLCKAAGERRLRRNFQGYTTDNCNTLIGLGASSISSFPGGYVQNEVATGRYADAIENGLLPAVRGYAMTEDDTIRAAIIERLMCDFRFDFEWLGKRFGTCAIPYIGEARMHAAIDERNLCGLDAQGFHVRDEARPLVRIVASWFDAHLKDSEFRFSRAV